MFGGDSRHAGAIVTSSRFRAAFGLEGGAHATVVSPKSRKKPGRSERRCICIIAPARICAPQ